MFGFWNKRRKAVSNVLTDCCLQGASANVIAPESGTVCRGAFENLDGSNVMIRFASGESPLLSEL